ncbi:hypothetical protein, partial [Ancylobacter sp. G4_0304]|uniref:hypothetical protein n=1 Tax=Ancylobacter sp. G4_0304 TaxID=3114289 RepID=UPI0039C749CA
PLSLSPALRHPASPLHGGGAIPEGPAARRARALCRGRYAGRVVEAFKKYDETMQKAGYPYR